MVEFNCDKCGQKLRMPEEHAGKRCRCPECKNILTVPSPILFEFEPGPPKEDATVAAGNFSDEQKRIQPAQDTGQKKSGILDIFLYPTSVHGLTIIGILVVVTVLIELIMAFVGPMCCIIIFLCLCILAVLGFYMFWYFTQCIHQSADGETKASGVLVDAPSLGDMGWQSLQIFICLCFFAAPVVFYRGYTGRTDVIFYLLLAYAVFFLPMGLLAVVMHDSLTALNPLLLVGSIIKTFFSYLKLVILFYVVGYLLFLSDRLFSFLPGIFVVAVNVVVFLYLLMVMSHLLGRFYRLNEERLDW
jgi:hypothetical protein